MSQFRERYYGTTESEPESETEANPATDPYKFDSPDSIATAIESKTERRKKKRLAALKAETTWNEGLACFERRRNVWTGAAAVKKYVTHRAQTHMEEGDDSSSANPSPPPDASPSQTSDYPIIPVPVSLLADNPIRQSISSKAYHDIYDKIVVSSRSPAVPINLSDMTRALVQGWKENGEWPPKAAPLDPLAGRKRAALVGIKIEHGDGPFLSNHPHMKKGMDSVRRIFHLNGHHHEHDAAGNNG